MMKKRYEIFVIEKKIRVFSVTLVLTAKFFVFKSQIKYPCDDHVIHEPK